MVRVCKRAKWVELFENHRMHQAYAVVLEEVGEAVEDMNVMIDWLHKIWACTRHDHNPAPGYKSMRDAALEAAAECIQVAAMCGKALRSEGVVRET